MNHPVAFVGADDSDLVDVAGVVGSDEHRHSLVEVFHEKRIVEGVEDGLITHTVLSCTREDPWRVTSYLAIAPLCKITCDTTAPTLIR